MYRGNAQRTGNADGKAGPANPAVLWVHPSKEHFIASPTPAGDRVFFTGLGAFNVSTFYCLATDPKAEPRTLVDQDDAVPQAAHRQFAGRGRRQAHLRRRHAPDRRGHALLPQPRHGPAALATAGPGRTRPSGRIADRRGRPRLHRRRHRRRALRGHEPRHAGRQGDGPAVHPENPRQEMGGIAGEVRGRQEERPDVRRAADRRPAAASRRRCCSGSRARTSGTWTPR